MIKRIAATGVASLAIVGAMALPASATFYGNTSEVGYVRADSTCGSTTCTVKLNWGSSVRTATPSKYGYVYGGSLCPNGASGDTIYTAITSDELVGEYVSVIYGGSGAQGAINCK